MVRISFNADQHNRRKNDGIIGRSSAPSVREFSSKGGESDGRLVNPAEKSRLRSPFHASSAAIELDNIVLGRGTKTVAIGQLIRILESGIPAAEERTTPMSMITPTVAVMDRVVRKAKPKASLDDVVIEYDSLIEGLKRVAADTSNHRRRPRPIRLRSRN